LTGEHWQGADVARLVLSWLNDERAYAETLRELLALREKVARPGACARAAQRIIDVVEEKRTPLAA
jgi:hypothetical protein